LILVALKRFLDDFFLEIAVHGLVPVIVLQRTQQVNVFTFLLLVLHYEVLLVPEQHSLPSAQNQVLNESHFLDRSKQVYQTDVFSYRFVTLVYYFEEPALSPAGAPLGFKEQVNSEGQGKHSEDSIAKSESVANHFHKEGVELR